MSFIRQAWQSSWFLIIPVLLLSGFIIYIFLPGSIFFSKDDKRLTKLRLEKSELQATLQKLTLQSEASVCIGEELVIPSGGVDDIMPPRNTNVVVEKLENSVVLVLSSSGSDSAFGSGFFVSPTKIATNGHVVEGAASMGADVFVVNKHIGVLRARISDIQFSNDYSEDFALLTIDEPVGIPMTVVNAQTPSDYKLNQVFAGGFPGAVIESDDGFIKLLETGNFSAPDLVITDGTISSHQKFFGEVMAFVHTAQISGGNSGGPLVNHCGDVLGVNTFINNSTEGVRNFSLTSLELLRFLSRSMVVPRVAAKECK